MTLKRNYHYCESCKSGFYPVATMLDLPEDGELTAEMEKRVLDFALNDVYGECADRWALHFIPTHSSWFNMVERFFSTLTTQALQRHQTRGPDLTHSCLSPGVTVLGPSK